MFSELSSIKTLSSGGFTWSVYSEVDGSQVTYLTNEKSEGLFMHTGREQDVVSGMGHGFKQVAGTGDFSLKGYRSSGGRRAAVSRYFGIETS